MTRREYAFGTDLGAITTTPHIEGNHPVFYGEKGTTQDWEKYMRKVRNMSIFMAAGILAIGAWCSVHYGSDSGPDNYEACELYYVEDGDNLWNISKSKFPKADNNIDVLKSVD